MYESLREMIRNILTYNERYVLNGEAPIEGFTYSSGWRLILPTKDNKGIFSTLITIKEAQTLNNGWWRGSSKDCIVISEVEVDTIDPILYQVLDNTLKIEELKRNTLVKCGSILGEEEYPKELKKELGIANPDISCYNTRIKKGLSCECVCLITLEFTSPIEFIKGIDFYG